MITRVFPAEMIDLCTAEGRVKELNRHRNVYATAFFKPREVCLVVQVHGESPLRLGLMVPMP